LVNESERQNVRVAASRQRKGSQGEGRQMNQYGNWWGYAYRVRLEKGSDSGGQFQVHCIERSMDSKMCSRSWNASEKSYFAVFQGALH
jgi:hypothetical protein